MSETNESQITPDEVRKVARLSRLAISDEDAQMYAERLGVVLGYVDRLRGLDLEGVAPMAHALEASNRLDPDEPGETLPVEALMAMAPVTSAPFVKVPKVLGEGGGA